jgi:hypothetical protein
VARREEYRCSIARNGDGRIVSLTVHATDLEGTERHVTVRGARVPEVVSPLQELLRERKISGRAWTSTEPIELDQVAGAHVELLLRAVQPLRRGDRAQIVADGIASMSREEASYWHAKAQRPGGLRALRVLLADGRRR